ncbi:DUF1203 domain-containing protein [Sphingomonas sp.]|uniref:DUF1203 domain-containing protein n=1 Tax=Sphingomonas sp. TaxID=28214 RepID=UPI002DF1AFD1|nr:DUF1203 domain-containing protein [Sphingomonas sp.]
MAYLIQGLDPQLARAADARRVTVTAKPGFPCRATLEDAEIGETVLLFNHVSNDSEGPFRASFAIYVREQALVAITYCDVLPPVFATRTISLRGFDEAGDLRTAELASGEEIDPAIRAMLERPDIAFINAHNAAAGCFAARIVRD